jgi:hypothetical protein
MGKTKKDVIKHLSIVGYKDDAQDCILVYLYAKGIIAKDEDIDMLDGNCSLEDFLDWYEELSTRGVLISIFEDICARAEVCQSVEEMVRYTRQMDLIAQLADIDVDGGFYLTDV